MDSDLWQVLKPGTPVFNIIAFIVGYVIYHIGKPLVMGWIANRHKVIDHKLMEDAEWREIAKALRAEISDLRNCQIADLKSRVDTVEAESASCQKKYQAMSQEWQSKYNLIYQQWMNALSVAEQQKAIIAELEATNDRQQTEIDGLKKAVNGG